jgi:hypothetical protein
MAWISQILLSQLVARLEREHLAEDFIDARRECERKADHTAQACAESRLYRD